MYTFVLCKANGERIGELRNCTERSVTLSINRVSTASFGILGSNPLLLNLFAEDTLLQVWEDGELRFYGYVLTPELSMNDTNTPITIKVNAVCPAWRLTRRVLGQSKGGTNYTGDKAAATKTMIDELNAAGETGIKTTTVESGSTGTYIAGPYKTALQCINDLAHGFDGFDWYMMPLFNEEPKLVTYEAKAVYGSVQKAVMEFGSGAKNVRQLSFLRDNSNLTNRAFHLPDGGLDEEGAVVRTKEDATSIAAHGLFEEVTEGFGLTDTALRDEWLSEVIRVKKNSRFVVSATLDIDDGTGRVPKFGTDFFVGDFVSARAMVENVTLFNGRVRVYQVKIDLDSNGTATVIPVLIEEGE
jgi:hypothetical protein